jgi:oligoendopeptidase F
MRRCTTASCSATGSWPRARNFGSTLDAALDGNAIPPAVVETLIDATRAGSAPFQRYARLRQKLLGLPSYHPYDSFMPIYQSTKSYPFELARDLALASVAPLGDEYVARYKRFVSGGRIDVYENEGKRSGAYSAGVYGVGPFMLMNYNDTLDAAVHPGARGGATRCTPCSRTRPSRS